MNSNYWPIVNGYFVFPDELSVIRSAAGNEIKEAVVRSVKRPKLFLRGSLLEQHAPFRRADADLFVLYTDRNELYILSTVLPNRYVYDIKFIQQDGIDLDYVYAALLHCRSVQLTGECITRKPICADKEFAWEHWKKYCIPLIPNLLDTSNPGALMHFKALTRCFGVLSYLKQKSFTRDISECLSIAKSENNISYDVLYQLRESLEKQQVTLADVTLVKKYLIRTFDLYFSGWIGD